MEPLSLEQTTLINISIGLYMGNDIKPFTIKQSNGLIALEKALPLLQTKVLGFPVTLTLKNRLMDLVQKTGYELYMFLNKFTIKDSPEPMKVEWTSKGVVDEIKTLRGYLQETKNYSTRHFKMAGTVFDRLSAKKIWSNLNESEKNLCRTNFRNSLFPGYWIYELEDRLSDFPQDYGSLMIGFDGNDNLNVSMLWHSLAVNNTNAIYYFYDKLTENDELSKDEPDKNLEYNLLKYVIKSSRREGFRFILSILEKPIVDEQVRRLIINITDCEYLKNFLEFVLRQVNIFGELHFNIFCYLLSNVSRKYPSMVEESLDFYALTLLSKGICERFDFLSEIDAKDILYRRIYDRLNRKCGLSIFVTIHFNKYMHLLRGFLNWLAVTEKDRSFFNDSATAIVNGTQYETPN